MGGITPGGGIIPAKAMFRKIVCFDEIPYPQPRVVLGIKDNRSSYMVAYFGGVWRLICFLQKVRNLFPTGKVRNV